MKFVVIETVNGEVRQVKPFVYLDKARTLAEQIVDKTTYERVPGKLWWTDDAISGFEVIVFDVENQHVVNIDD